MYFRNPDYQLCHRALSLPEVQRYRYRKFSFYLLLEKKRVSVLISDQEKNNKSLIKI